MRDADHIQERGAPLRFHVVGLTLMGVVVLGAVFGLGFVVGRRVTRLQQPTEVVTDPLAQLDAERKVYDKLTFYQQLTAARPGGAGLAPPLAPPAAPVAAAPASAPAAAPAPKAPKVATEDSKVLAALSAGPATQGQFTVQVSSFQTREEAKAFSSALERKGFKPFVVAAEIPAKGTWYRVRLGRFDDEGQAKAAKGVLARADIPAWVLRSD